MNPTRLIACLSLFLCAATFAAERVALVIGNNAYTHARPLNTAKADAVAVAAKLRDLKFQVIERTEAKRDDFPEAITEFLTAAKDAKMVFIYFAGHGMESAALGGNFLIPVDAVLEKESHLESQAYSLNTLLDRLRGLSAPVRLVVLDCCRNNPLEGRSWSAGRGENGLGAIDLQRLDAATMVVFSASPGKVAKERISPLDKHGPFATALLEEIAKPGSTAIHTFAQVEDAVFRSTGEAQRPKTFFSGSLAPFNAFAFVPGNTVPYVEDTYALLAGKAAGELREIEVAPGVKMRFRWCSPGRFTMGSPETEKAKLRQAGVEENWFGGETPHPVELTRGFWLAETEVTQGQWKALMDTGLKDEVRAALQDDTLYNLGGKQQTLRDYWGAAKDADPATRIGVEDDHIAMYFINHAGAEEWCRRAGRNAGLRGWTLALPTEAQWEYACRSGTDTMTWTGDFAILGESNAPGLDKISWYSGNSSVGYTGQGWATEDWKEKQYPGGNAGPRAVKTKLASEWGLHDMIGNVLEWCADWYGTYPAGAVTDPTGPVNGSYRVLRGGSWGNYAHNCRAAYRNRNTPTYRNNNLGFRPAAVPAGAR